MLEYSITDTVNGIKYRPYLFIRNNAYAALGDDFLNLNSHSLKLALEEISDVLNGNIEQGDIYGYVCFRINVTRSIANIYCYDEFLGKESTADVFTMLKELTVQMELFESQNRKA